MALAGKAGTAGGGLIAFPASHSAMSRGDGSTGEVRWAAMAVGSILRQRLPSGEHFCGIRQLIQIVALQVAGELLLPPPWTAPYLSLAGRSDVLSRKENVRCLDPLNL